MNDQESGSGRWIREGDPFAYLPVGTAEPGGSAISAAKPTLIANDRVSQPVEDDSGLCGS